MRPATKKNFILTYRIFFVLLVTVAVGFQLSHGLQQTNFSIINFFSFFTIESNLFGAVIFIMSAYTLYKKRRDKELESLRGAATLYMVITGIVYSTALAGLDVQVPIPWVNFVLHYLFPIVILLDWFYDQPKRRFSPKDTLLWLVFPLFYGVYSLVRGPLANNWYPYPFINAHTQGYALVLLNSIIVALVAFALATILARLPSFIKKYTGRKAQTGLKSR